MGYSPERKAAVLKRMLPPNNLPVRRLSQDEGISEATLHKWRAQARSKGQLLPDADAGPEGWTSRDKFAAVLGHRYQFWLRRAYARRQAFQHLGFN